MMTSISDSANLSANKIATAAYQGMEKLGGQGQTSISPFYDQLHASQGAYSMMSENEGVVGFIDQIFSDVKKDINQVKKAERDVKKALMGQGSLTEAIHRLSESKRFITALTTVVDTIKKTLDKIYTTGI